MGKVESSVLVEGMKRVVCCLFAVISGVQYVTAFIYICSPRVQFV